MLPRSMAVVQWLSEKMSERMPRPLTSITTGTDGIIANVLKKAYTPLTFNSVLIMPFMLHKIITR